MSVGFEDALHALDRSADLLLSALAALDRLDAVGIAEEHSATLELFAKVLSLPDPGREYCTNVGDAEGKPSLGPADLAAVEAITEIDRAVYQRGRELFKARARSII